MVKAADGWVGLLDADERILWQGQPDTQFNLRLDDLKSAGFGLFFTAFSLFWMAMAFKSGGYFWMFGLLHFAVGASITARALLKNWWIRRFSHYSLSNKRAFIATDLPYMGRKLRSWPISPMTELTLIEGKSDSLFFGQDVTATGHGQIQRSAVGFEQIQGGREVHALMRAIQRGHEE